MRCVFFFVVKVAFSESSGFDSKPVTFTTLKTGQVLRELDEMLERSVSISADDGRWLLD